MSARLRTVALLALVAAIMLLAAAGSVSAQTTGGGESNVITTISTTSHSNFTDVTLPGVTVVAPSQPVLSSQLQAALGGANGGAIQTALINLGVLGPASAAALIATQFTGSTFSVTTTSAFGPATILIGQNQSQTFFVVPGTLNINTNTHTESFFERLFQASRPLSNQGVGFLLGDLHTTFQTTLIDDGFRFMDSLLDRGRNGGGESPCSRPRRRVLRPTA